MKPLLKIENLHLSLTQGSCTRQLLRGISFEIYPGEIVGLVGESGSGKSLTAASILGLLPSNHHVKGHIEFENQHLLTLSPKKLSHLRGTRLSLILQDPALALNPLLPIGKQLMEGLYYHTGISKQEGDQKAIEWLHRVGIGDPSARMGQYPHEISGGMKQRILIAMALMCRPSLLIADEPTTALDPTTQLQILHLLEHLQKEEQMSLLMITHDLGVIARLCQRVMVMYAGQLIESGSVHQIFQSPQHPFTQALLASRRAMMDSHHRPLISLEGSAPQIHHNHQGCFFAPRCPFAMKICARKHPPNIPSSNGSVLCWLPAANRQQASSKGSP
ncbi:MAG: ABC transporter ATP-binding protein [Parachlamydiaceae bacterium]